MQLPRRPRLLQVQVLQALQPPAAVPQPPAQLTAPPRLLLLQLAALLALHPPRPARLALAAQAARHHHLVAQAALQLRLVALAEAVVEAALLAAVAALQAPPAAALLRLQPLQGPGEPHHLTGDLCNQEQLWLHEHCLQAGSLWGCQRS